MMSQTLDREELERRVADALYAKSPEDTTGLDVVPFGNAEDHGRVRYYLYRDVLSELVKAARYRDQVGVAILMGQFCMDERGPFIEITAFRDLEYRYDDEEDLVERLLPALRRAHREAAEEEEFHLVGAFVSRPGGRAELSEETARMHLSLFNMPFQVALLVDGVHNCLALYRRVPGQPFANAPFYLVSADETASQETIRGESHEVETRMVTEDDVEHEHKEEADLEEEKMLVEAKDE